MDQEPNVFARRVPGLRRHTRFDDHCPGCGEPIDLKLLAKPFDMLRYDALEKITTTMTCPHCMDALEITVCVEFAIKGPPTLA